ncbi:MAG TPA: hypothetical protein VGM76_14025 [Lacipirellulaceae bacterium]
MKLVHLAARGGKEIGPKTMTQVNCTLLIVLRKQDWPLPSQSAVITGSFAAIPETKKKPPVPTSGTGGVALELARTAI